MRGRQVLQVAQVDRLLVRAWCGATGDVDQGVLQEAPIIAENVPLFDAFFTQHEDLFEWAPPQGGAVAFPRYRGADGVEQFCRDLIETAGVFVLPASIYTSDLAQVPTDRFRIGVGRLDPGPALAALDDFLAVRPTP